MGRISFFTALIDDNISWTERDAINSAHDRADAALQQGDTFGQAISGMQRTIVQQQNQLKLLSSMVGVLAAILRDNNLIDPEILDARLEAAVLNAEEDVRMDANTITCLKCNRQVLKTDTVMTEIGVMCDRCHAQSTP